MSSQPVRNIDRENEFQLRLDELITQLGQYNMDMYYQAQGAGDELTPDELDYICDWSDNVTNFYRSCLQIQSALKDKRG